MTALDLSHTRLAVARLPEMLANKIAPGAGNCFQFRRVLQIIIAATDELLRFHHDEMFARHERPESFTGFGDDAAAIRQADEHPVPFEIAQLRVMHTEQ